jgi:hypothetical protein
VEGEGTGEDTTGEGEGEVTYLEVMLCPEMVVGAVRMVEEATGVGEVEEWEVTTKGREVSPPEDSEEVEEVEVAVLWRLSLVPEAYRVSDLARRKVSSSPSWSLSRNAFCCGVAELLRDHARPLLGRRCPPSWLARSFATSR